MSFFFLLAPAQNFQDLEKSACSLDPKADKASRGPKELSVNISALPPTRSSRALSTAVVEPIIDPLLHKEQAGFRRGKSTKDQAILVTKKSRNFCPFIDLTATYDIVWHCDLICSG